MPNLDKYKELYDLSLHVFREEDNRARRLDDKAARFVTVLTAIIGVYGFFSNWVVANAVPPENTVEWFLIINYALLFITLTVAWIVMLMGLSLSKRKKIPLNEGIINLFKQNRLIDIYYSFAIKLKKEHQENRATTEQKVKRFSLGYAMTFISLLLLASLCTGFGVYQWKTPSVLNNTEERRETMPDDPNDQGEQDNNSQDEDEPQEVDIPPFDHVREDLDPQFWKKREKKDKTESVDGTPTKE